jgi:hypothetical protein
MAEANRDKIRNYNLSQINNGAYNIIRVGDVLTIPGDDAQPSTGFLFPTNSGGGGGSKSMSPIVIILAVAAVAYLASR